MRAARWPSLTSFIQATTASVEQGAITFTELVLIALQELGNAISSAPL
jgi:hypothetical protein